MFSSIAGKYLNHGMPYAPPPPIVETGGQKFPYSEKCLNTRRHAFTGSVEGAPFWFTELHLTKHTVTGEATEQPVFKQCLKSLAAAVAFLVCAPQALIPINCVKQLLGCFAGQRGPTGLQKPRPLGQ